VEDVALGDAEGAFEVGRRVETLRHHGTADGRHEAPDLLQQLRLEAIALEAPVRARERIRQVLDEAGHHVAARRRERIVDQRGHQAVDPELLRDAAAARFAVSGLRALEPGHERELRAPQRVRARLLVRQSRLLGQHQVELAAGPVHLDAGHRRTELRLERRRRHQPEVGALRVRVRNHERGVDLAAVREHDADRAAAFDAHRRDLGGGPQLHADPTAGLGHGRRDRAHAAHHVPDEALLRLRAAAEQVEQEAEQRARVIGPAVLAVQAVREDE